MTEQWRVIPGHEKYQVSDHGRVKSFQPTSGSNGGRRKGSQDRILKPWVSGGYQMVDLGRHNHRLVHRLVLEAFVGPCPPGLECRHGDGNKANCDLSNLSWDTRSVNAIDRTTHNQDRWRHRFHRGGGTA